MVDGNKGIESYWNARIEGGMTITPPVSSGDETKFGGIATVGIGPQVILSGKKDKYYSYLEDGASVGVMAQAKFGKFSALMGTISWAKNWDEGGLSGQLNLGGNLDTGQLLVGANIALTLLKSGITISASLDHFIDNIDHKSMDVISILLGYNFCLL